MPGRCRPASPLFLFRRFPLDHVVAWVGVAMLVIVTGMMIAGVIWWIVSMIKRRNRGW